MVPPQLTSRKRGLLIQGIIITIIITIMVKLPPSS